MDHPFSRLEFGKRRLSVVLQNESAECGLACLAMLASWHGLRTDLTALRARFSLSLKGANLAQLVRYADELQLNARPLRLEMHELAELQLPCILHWDLNHFVVLKSTSRHGIVIHDPAVGIRNIAHSEVSKHFTGVALELVPTAQFKPADEQRRVKLRDLIGKVDGLQRAMGMVFVMALALEALALVSPMFNQWVVDEALVSNDEGLLNVLLIGFALMLVMQTAISLARSWTMMVFSTHLNLQWNSKVFTHLLRLPMTWFEKRHLGDVVSRFGSVAAIQHTLTSGFIGAILDGLMACLTLFMMLLYSAKLATVVVGAVFAYGVLRAIAYQPLRETSVESLALSAKEQSCFLEAIRAVQAIKLFGRELERRSRWQTLVVDAINRSVRTQKFMMIFGVANTGIFGLQNLLVFWLGAHMVMSESFSVGMLFAFTTYGGQFTGRMASLIDKGIEFKMLSMHAERLADIVLEQAEQEKPPVSIDHLSPKIEVVDVSFRYGDGEPWVLRHVNLVIEPGDALAFVGPSGCGKTTLVKIILGLLTPCEGEVRFGGIPIQQLGQQAYRSALAVVMQDDQLLSGSLAENICFFDPHPDQKRIEESARLAAIHDDIVAMPMGYHTLSGDMGTSLSGGQRQRLLLARALYKAPAVLVMDEATSNLDVVCERKINAAIRAMTMTRICVAHRPETIAMARRIVKLSRGEIELDELQLTS